jgi:hypothetical protein
MAKMERLLTAKGESVMAKAGSLRLLTFGFFASLVTC